MIGTPNRKKQTTNRTRNFTAERPNSTAYLRIEGCQQVAKTGPDSLLRKLLVLRMVSGWFRSA